MRSATILAGSLLLGLIRTAFAEPVSPGSDGDFVLGLRRIGVLAGQAVICTPDPSREAEIGRVDKAGNLIASEYGLRAAFNFIGAAGYGSGRAFDKATCPAVLKQWTDVQLRYGER